MRLPSKTPPELSGLVQREIEVNGLRIAYTEAGSGPPVLLLHGAVFAGNVFWWDTQAALAPIARTIAPDFPGWGASDKPIRPYDMRLYEEFLLGFLAALELDRVTIIGHSMGGLIGSGFAVLHPERVASLTTLAVPPAWSDFEIPKLFRPFMVPVLGDLMMWSLPLLPVKHPLGIRRAYEGLFHAPDRIPAAKMREMLEGCRAITAEPGHRHAFLSTFRTSHAYLGPDMKQEFRERLAAVEYPILVVAGRHDPLFPLDVVEAGARHKPAARFEVLDPCGHFPTWEQPERVHGLLEGMVRDPSRTVAIL